MPYITEEQAAAEVSTWSIVFQDLKPALVTNQDLWDLYHSRNSGWGASICELGVTAATTALTGAGAFNILDWMSDAVANNRIGEVVANTVKDVAIEKTVEKGIDRIAGAHVTDFDESKKTYKLDADKRFATKVASGFLTVLISAAGGALTVATGGSAAVVTAIAVMVWIGDREEAAQQQRWNEIVKSMGTKYNDIRQKKQQKIDDSKRTELERFVMSNARHDLEDRGLVKKYTWKSGNGQHVAVYTKANLKQLLKAMKDLDGDLGEKLRTFDLLEISRVFHEETLALWNATEKQAGRAKDFPSGPSGNAFDKARMEKFMRRQIDTHCAFDEMMPIGKAEKRLAALREQALTKYGALSEIEMEEGKVYSMPTASATLEASKGLNFARNQHA